MPRGIKKFASIFKSEASGPVQLECRFDGRILKANDCARSLLSSMNISKMNRLLPDDHFELINRALHSGDVVVSANKIDGYTFEWKYFLDKGAKVIRIESIQYAQYKENKLTADLNPGEGIKERWSNFVDTLPVSVCVTETNSDEIIVINQLAMRLLGIKAGTESNTKLRQVFTDGEAINEINDLLVEQGFVKDLKLSVISKTGNRWARDELWVLVNIKLVRKVEGSYLVWTFSDHTESTKIEGALEESENKFENAIQGAQEGIWEWQAGLEGKEWWSEPMFDLLGLESGGCDVGLSQLQRLLHPEDRNLFSSFDRQKS